MGRVVFHQQKIQNVTLEVDYNIVFEDTYTVFVLNNVESRIGISKMVDPLIAEIFNDSDVLINIPFEDVSEGTTEDRLNELTDIVDTMLGVVE